jgi:hypothetical protein
MDARKLAQELYARFWATCYPSVALIAWDNLEARDQIAWLDVASLAIERVNAELAAQNEKAPDSPVP